MSKQMCLAVGLVIMVCSARAESEWAVTNFWKDPYAGVLYTFVGESGLDPRDTEQEGSKVKIHEVDASASLPVWRQGPHILLAGLSVKWNRFEFTNVGIGDENVYALKAPVEYFYDGSGDWVVWGNVTPGVFSDLERWEADDYKTQAHGLLVYRWRPALHLAGGVAYDSAFGDDDVYPMGGFIWRAGEQWQINMLLPQPSVLWKPDERLVVFADARPAGDKWNVRVRGEPGDFDFKLQAWRVGGGLEYRLMEDVWFHLAAGATIERTYEVSNLSTEVYKADAEDSWFVRSGLMFR